MVGSSAAARLRWLAMGVFWLSFSINFLDRQLLAAVAPFIKSEFQLSNAQYGQLISAFFFVYALTTPLAGLLVDRIGLRAGASVAVTLWSVACAATAFTTRLPTLLACRMGLGFGESAGFPTLAKATVAYLTPAERGPAGGFGAASISLGSMIAPLVAAALVPQYGWRSVFLVSGLLGFLWVPLWLFTARQIPPIAEPPSIPTARQPLRDPRLWAILLAYCLVYTLYSLWSNWTTLYLVQERHLSAVEANARYAWFPPAFAILGGFLGGTLSFYWIRNGIAGFRARMRANWAVSPLLLVGAAMPFLPGTAMAAAAIGISFLAFQSILGCLFLIPLDIFEPRRAAFAISVLAFGAAGTQVLAAPAFGALIDRAGFTLPCLIASLLPLLGLAVLDLTLRRHALDQPGRLS